MVAIVRLALRRPYTFVVMAILIVIFGVLAVVRTATDIFPDIRIPVIAVVWTYRGLSPDDMAGRVIYYYERQLSTAVNDMDHIESQSLPGVGVVKIFFHPTVDIRTATAQVTSLSQTVLKQMPPGITPPQILNYNASTVPILQLGLSSPTLGEGEVNDLGQNFIRPALASVPGTAVPSPYGGRERQIQIDLNPQALNAYNLSAQDVSNALANQNQIIPAGTIKVGQFEYNVRLNNSPSVVDELNRLPVKQVGGATIYMSDVGHVRDGAPPQRNEVRMDGRRAVLMTVLKSGSASTLDIVDGVKKILPRLKQTLPPDLKVLPLADQSIFVRAAVSGVVKEGVIAAALTSLMILLFLGSWRSTLVITVSIPLAILFSIALLSALGQTLNIMTLGGLALAVGILVDDATVTIENINWHLEQRKPVRQAILDGAQQIVLPAFVSLLCICIAFVPMFFLPGVSGFLFAPMAEAVLFAMIGSFILSRTLVPTMASYLLVSHGDIQDASVARNHDAVKGHHPKNPLARFQHGFEQRFETVRKAYGRYLEFLMDRRVLFAGCFLGFVALSLCLTPFLGENFFPAVDAGVISLHVRAPMGTRIEETAALFDHVEKRIREVIPARDLDSIVDNIGLPVSGTNRAYLNTGGIGPEDGDILITLKKDHRATAGYVKDLRTALPQSFPGSNFAFLPADIVSQILNFGSPAPIDVQVSGPDKRAAQRYATELLRKIQSVPGAADARLEQSSRYPQFGIDVDRTRAGLTGITEKDVTNSLVVNLAGSFQTAPTFWLNPKNGVSYPIVIQTPQYSLDTLAGLKAMPITSSGTTMPQLLGGLSDITREASDAVVSHYAIQPTFDVYATTQGADLGTVANRIQTVLKDSANHLPPGATVNIRGQVETMNSAFSGLFFGLAEAIVLIYLLIVVNFHSWSDPFVIVMALPAALAGICWTLFATHTSLSVPALTGAIMCMGVATANSILIISFARERLDATGNAVKAAIEAGVTRFRPVLMTALAMIIGMAPMALGLGEGGEQNAPLGRAVIGGLFFATFATLFFVPALFALVRGRGHAQHAWEKEMHLSPENDEMAMKRRIRHVVIGVAILLGVVLLFGAYSRFVEASDVRDWTHESQIPTVTLIAPKAGGADQPLVLPGTLSAYYDAKIYAQVAGYVKSWNRDIGAHVKKGEVLAIIDTPELDQQITQARADLSAAAAAEKLSAVTASRWRDLLRQDAVARQDVDVKDADLAAKTEALKSAQANLDRLLATKQFAHITAPFDGMVTARNLDVGTLVGSSSGNPLFTVSDTHALRLYVNVPQSYTADILPGMAVSLTVPEYPGRLFPARLSSSSGAISSQSSTMLVQFEAPNGDGLLKPGDVAQVSLGLPAKGLLRLPASALIFRASGLAVATMGTGDHVVIKPVTVGVDLGASVMIATGLSPRDRVIDNPPDSLANGDTVRIAPRSS